MSILLLVAVLCTGSALSQVQVPCYGEGCVNVTVYLGPRWGSRVVMVPRTETTSHPEVDSSGGQVEASGHRYEHDLEHRPERRPVPPGGVFQVDMMDDEFYSKTPFPTQNPLQTTRNPYRSNNLWAWWDPLFTMTTGRPSGYRTTVPPSTEIHVVIDQYNRGTVDLSWRGHTGETVKQVLMSLSQPNRARVNKLVLDWNWIRQLPVLVFPVEFEYGLQELSLSYNLFNPTFLSSYTRFELSRLGRLKTLNMTRCNLAFIDMPDLPSLEVLDLSYNKLSSLPSSLARLDKLVQLFLRGNRITYISDYPLSSLTCLWVLDLSNNGLQEIQGEPLENLRSLVTIKLDNNRLRSLPLLDRGRTKIMSIANNSLQCSCTLLHSLSWQNIEFEYYSYDSCQNDYDAIPLSELRLLPGRYQHLCKSEWWKRAWTEVLWYLRNYYGTVLYVMLVMVILLVMLKTWKKSPGKKGIPYNLLDDQQVSTVSGQHIDV